MFPGHALPPVPPRAGLPRAAIDARRAVAAPGLNHRRASLERCIREHAGPSDGRAEVVRDEQGALADPAEAGQRGGGLVLKRRPQGGSRPVAGGGARLRPPSPSLDEGGEILCHLGQQGIEAAVLTRVGLGRSLGDPRHDGGGKRHRKRDRPREALPGFVVQRCEVGESDHDGPGAAQPVR